MPKLPRHRGERILEPREHRTNAMSIYAPFNTTTLILRRLFVRHQRQTARGGRRCFFQRRSIHRGEMRRGIGLRQFLNLY